MSHVSISEYIPLLPAEQAVDRVESAGERVENGEHKQLSTRLRGRGTVWLINYS